MTEKDSKLTIFLSIKQDIENSIKDLNNDNSFINENIEKLHDIKDKTSNDNLIIKLYSEYIQNNLDLIKNKNKLLILVNKNIENLCEHDWQKDNTDTHVYYECDKCSNIKK